MPSYCYEDAELNCRQYGRLYGWESARRVCESMGDGWRLPTDDEWRKMSKHYGGISEDSADRGKAAYKALLAGGDSGFNALLGGGRSDDGHYARLEAHGFYWTASESDPDSRWFYNFSRGGQALHRQSGGEKREHFPFAVSASDVSKTGNTSAEIYRTHRIAANNAPPIRDCHYEGFPSTSITSVAKP
jgi:uncharacterized protein (TIGR02145 family)